MKIEVVEEKENPLLKRKEIIASVDYEGKATPSVVDLQKHFASHFKVKEELIEITKVFSEMGMAKGKAWVKVWETKPPVRKKKSKEKKEEAKPQEKPKEEKK